MITPSAFVGDSTTYAPFIKARFQNNLYMAQECLRPDNGNASSKLIKLQEIMTNASKATLTHPMTTAQYIQDALAVEHIYLEADEINRYFLNKSDTKVASKLIDTTDATAMNAYWGQILFHMMKDAADGYVGGDADKREGKTKEAYVSFGKHLNATSKTINGKSCNDIWLAIESTAGSKLEKDETPDSYMENFATKAGFTQAKIQRHHEYLDTEFFRLAANHWWYDKDTSSNPVAASQFRLRVLGVNPGLNPQCLVRVSTEPPRGTPTFQAHVTGKRRTTRIDLKGSPFGMDALAEFLKASGSHTFDASVVGTDPNNPLSKLAGKENPFHNAVFKIGEQWFIIGAHEANGALVVQKRKLTVNPATGTPIKDSATHAYTNVTIAETGSLLSLTDMDRATGLDNKPIDLAKVVEEGLKTLITLCGYGVVDNSLTTSDDLYVGLTADAPAPALFRLDDRALLMEQLLTPGWNLHDPAKSAAQDAIFAAADTTTRTKLVATILDANIVAVGVFEKQTALADVFAYFHTHPDAYAALHTEWAKVVPAADIVKAMDAIHTRHTDAGAKLQALNLFEKAAFRTVFWGGILANLLELSSHVPPLTEGQVVDRLNEMIEKENDLYAGAGVLLGAHNAIGPRLVLGTVGRLGLSAVLDTVAGEIGTANTLTMAAGGAGTTLFAVQREELTRAALGTSINTLDCGTVRQELIAAHISLNTINTVPMAQYSHTDADKLALKAIAWTAILRRLLNELEKDSNVNAATLTQALKEAIEQERDELGNCIEPFDTATENLCNSASPPSNIVAYAVSMVNLYRIGAATGIAPAATTPPTAVGNHSTQLAPQMVAVGKILGNLPGVTVPATGLPTLNSGNPLLKPSDEATTNDFNAAELFPVQTALLRRHNMAEEAGMGWLDQAARATTGANVFHTGSSGERDYLSDGLMQWQKEDPSATKPLSVKTRAGEEIFFERCAAPAGQLTSHVYYQFTKADAAGKKQVYLPDPVEGRHLRTEVQGILKSYSDKVLAQSVASPMADKIHQVSPDPVNTMSALVDKHAATSSVSSTASTLKP